MLSQWQLKLHMMFSYRSKLNYSFVYGNVSIQIRQWYFRLWFFLGSNRSDCMFVCVPAGSGQYEPDWCPVSMPTEASGRGTPKLSCQKVTSLPQPKLYRVSDPNECPYTVTALLKCILFLFCISSSCLATVYSSAAYVSLFKWYWNEFD